ncbi:MAG: hypothetical protein WCQ23_05150 [Candidatus Methanomethylophilaceae archaeon]
MALRTVLMDAIDVVMDGSEEEIKQWAERKSLFKEMSALNIREAMLNVYK